jgi:hypothetical protein
MVFPVYRPGKRPSVVVVVATATLFVVAAYLLFLML